MIVFPFFRIPRAHFEGFVICLMDHLKLILFYFVIEFCYILKIRYYKVTLEKVLQLGVASFKKNGRCVCINKVIER